MFPLEHRKKIDSRCNDGPLFSIFHLGGQHAIRSNEEKMAGRFSNILFRSNLKLPSENPDLEVRCWEELREERRAPATTQQNDQVMSFAIMLMACRVGLEGSLNRWFCGTTINSADIR